MSKFKKVVNSKWFSLFMIILYFVIGTFGALIFFAYAFEYEGHTCDFYTGYLALLFYFTFINIADGIEELRKFAKTYGKRKTEPKD